MYIALSTPATKQRTKFSIRMDRDALLVILVMPATVFALTTSNSRKADRTDNEPWSGQR